MENRDNAHLLEKCEQITESTFFDRFQILYDKMNNTKAPEHPEKFSFHLSYCFEEEYNYDSNDDIENDSDGDNDELDFYFNYEEEDEKYQDDEEENYFENSNESNDYI